MTDDYAQLFTRNLGFVDQTEQERLRHSRVAVLGVGGMGGVVAQILARAGVGALSILDKDAFEPSNNNRQVYARTDTWGQLKVDVTAAELLKVNPKLDVRVEHHWGDDNVEQVLAGVDVVVNGMDELAACLRLWRASRERKLPVIDAWAAPLPNVYVLQPDGPTPEEFLEYPTVGRALDALTADDVSECKNREALHVVFHSRSLRYLDQQIIKEILTGERARISFAPMVWGAGLLMAWEAVKLLLGRGEIASRYGRFFDPWRGDVKNARGFTAAELALIRLGLKFV